MHVVKSLLEKGYRVRGTIRSQSKATHVQETFKAYGDALQLVVVSDITKVRAAYPHKR
jgi:nucleoside-diphosphate-sugar epimerase